MKRETRRYSDGDWCSAIRRYATLRGSVNISRGRNRTSRETKRDLPQRQSTNTALRRSTVRENRIRTLMSIHQSAMVLIMRNSMNALWGSDQVLWLLSRPVAVSCA